jgi:hypothetical protein
MAQSPFYTPINVQKSDFSGIARAGQSWAAAYEKAGKALEQIGSAYFDRKKYEDFAENFVKTDEAVKMWSRKGLNPFELQAAREDPKKARKMMGDIINQSGGVEAFQKQVLEEEKLGMLKEEHANAMQLSSLKTEEAGLALDALKRKTADEELSRELFAQAFKKDEETGEVKFDIDNIKTTEENRHMLPVVYDQFKKMGLLGKFNYSKWKNNLIQNNAWDASDRQGMSAMFDATAAAYPDMSGEDVRRFKQNLTDDTYEPDEVMDSANKWWNQNPNAKTWMEAEETNSKINTGLGNALAKGPDGQYIVKNASTAGFVIRQFARLANGVGVMTNEDVDAVKGASDAQSTWDRLKTRFLGDKVESRPATEEDVRNGFADRVGDQINIRLGARATAQDLLMIKDATQAFMEVNQRRLQKHGVELQEYLTNAYTGVPEERLLALSPYSQYWHDAHRFTISTKDLGKIRRMIAKDGEEETAIKLKKSNPNLRDSQIAEWFNRANQEPPPSNDIGGSPEPKQSPVGTNFDPAQPQVKEEIDNSSRPDVDGFIPDGLNTTNAIEFTAGTVAGKQGLKLFDYMKNNLARADMLESINEPHTRYKQAVKAFRDAPISKVKEFAKEMGVDPKAIKRRFGKGADLRLRETLEKKFKAKIQEKVSASIAKKGLGKKALSLIMRAAFSGGVGVATAAFDIIDIFDTKNEVAREELNKMLGQYEKGSQERKLIQGLLDDMNYRSGDFKKFQRDNPQLQQMGGGNKGTYELYRSRFEGA